MAMQPFLATHDDLVPVARGAMGRRKIRLLSAGMFDHRADANRASGG
jgi:hypothetical protein